MARLCKQVFGSPVGDLAAVVLSDDGAERLCLLEFGGSGRVGRGGARLEGHFGASIEDGRAGLHDEVERQVSGYFAGEVRGFTLPLELVGTGFQRRVWGALLEIPFGETCSYGELAVRVGSPGGQRAVGAANGANGVAIVVPCHRVIEAGGGLRGYGGGLERKRRLLEHEGSWPVGATLFEGVGDRTWGGA